MRQYQRPGGPRRGRTRRLVSVVGAAVVLVAPVAAQADLKPLRVDTAALVGNWQRLTIAGTVTVDVENAGTATAPSTSVVVFRDVDRDGAYDAALDDTLGTAQVPGLLPGAVHSQQVQVTGGVVFRGEPLSAEVDATGVIAEADEANNVSRSGLDCEVTPPGGSINPALEWAWNSSSIESTALNVMMTPGVIDVNGDAVPDVVFGSTSATGGLAVSGFLRALNGNDGSEIFTVNDPTLLVNTASSIAVGDIDGDGLAEIVACDESGTRLIAFENDGSFKWRTVPLEPIGWGAPSIADLTGDGSPEIVVGRQAIDAAGNLLWTGTAGRGTQGSAGPLSIVADIDLDSSPDVVAGNSAYDAGGTLKWTAAVPDGYPALANFDADPFPEIVLVSGGQVWLLQHDGTIAWGPVSIPGGGAGGPPTVADYDADGLPEIGVAGATRYAVFETGGGLKWAATTQDGSSNRTGSSVFDFNGDGAAEVVYRDELELRVYRGTDGFELFARPMSSCTWHEYVLVADVDADGNAEMIAVANNNCGFGPQRGVFVFGSADDSWVATRSIWNQHSYHITNVEDDGGIPAVEEASWLAPAGDPFNSYRQNQLGGVPPLAAPDLTASRIRVRPPAAPDTLVARIGNSGAFFVGTGIPVSFYDGDPALGGALLGTTTTTGPLQPGEYEDVELTIGGPIPTTIWASVDDAGGLVGTQSECNESNNIHAHTNAGPSLGSPVCGTVVSASTGGAVQFVVTASDADAGDVLTLTATGLPSGATLTPPPPVSGNPVTATFDWTPAHGQTGPYVVSFLATDDTGHGTTCDVTINLDTATYCTAKQNSLGCLPAVGFSGSPSASAGSGFFITCTNTLNQKNGTLIYSRVGQQSVPFVGGTLCIAAPLRLVPPWSSGGDPLPAQNCTGSYSYDYNRRISSGLDPVLVPGATIWTQYLSRDPGFPKPKNVGLSDAVQFTIAP